MDWCVADLNPTGVEPARDVIATALENLLLTEIGMV
jgi:hypothetical protein